LRNPLTASVVLGRLAKGGGRKAGFYGNS
jgi:hypothetical protein